MEVKLEQFFVKTRHEQHMWLSSAISILLHKDKLDFEEDWDIDVSDEDMLEIFRDRTSLKIDDYAIDMHCSAGRKLGKKKADFALEGCVVVGEDKEYYNSDWRELYCDLKVNPAKYGIVDTGRRPRPKSKKKKKDVDDLVEGIAGMKLESNMRFMDGSEIKEEDIKICMKKTCGNKVMCFEHCGRIWKESRASFGYNKDYELVDSCKEMFGLKKIGMERILSNFRIEKIDKKKSDWSGTGGKS